MYTFLKPEINLDSEASWPELWRPTSRATGSSWGIFGHAGIVRISIAIAILGSALHTKSWENEKTWTMTTTLSSISDKSSNWEMTWHEEWQGHIQAAPVSLCRGSLHHQCMSQYKKNLVIYSDCMYGCCK